VIGPTPEPPPPATPTPFVPVIIPQVFQNPAVQGIFAPGNRATATPVRPATAPAPSGVQSAAVTQPVVLRPPSTGDAGLWRLPSIW
jgi:hypothetical protein